jgi:uncharacterized protein
VTSTDAAGVDVGSLPPPQPLPDPDSEGFWAATAAGHLALCRCDTCGTWMHPPLERCRQCGGATSFQPVEGVGEVHSRIVQHRASIPGLGPEPYVIALVELDGAPGARVTGIVAAPPADVAVGSRVMTAIVDVPGGPFHQPQFELIRSEP